MGVSYPIYTRVSSDTNKTKVKDEKTTGGKHKQGQGDFTSSYEWISY